MQLQVSVHGAAQALNLERKKGGRRRKKKRKLRAAVWSSRLSCARSQITATHDQDLNKIKQNLRTNQAADHEGERLEQKQDNSPYHQLFGAHVFNNGPRHGEGKVGSWGGKRKNVTPSEEQSGTRRRNVASAAGGKASWTPPLSAALLLPLNFQGGGGERKKIKSRNHMTGKDSALSPNSRRRTGNHPRGG